MSKDTPTPTPTALRVTYLLLGWLTLVTVLGLVVASCAAAIDAGIPQNPPKASNGEAAAGMFVIAGIGGLIMLGLHLIEKAGKP